MEEESKRLIENYTAGDEQSFEALVDLHLKPLYSFLYLILRDKDATEDAIQETFIKVWRNLKKYDSNKKFKTWLYTIAKNTAFDSLKKKKALPFSSFEDEDGRTPFENISQAPEILEYLETEEMISAVDEALKRLSPLYRTLIVLLYREDFSLQETAEILKIPYNTLKSRHLRGIQKLQAEIQKDLHPIRTNDRINK